MKKILKFSFLLATLVLTTKQVRAKNIDFSLNLIKEDGKTVSFNLKEINTIALSIFDSNDALIFQEKVTNQDEINRSYDLTALPDGEYFLKAESDRKIATYKIEVKGRVAKLGNTAISTVYKPVVVNKNGMVTVNVLNAEQKTVKITVYGVDQAELYTQEIGSNQYVGKVFDLKNVQPGKYTFEIKNNGKTFVENVIIK
ncbi:DUF3244 domain-containing protein [Flavobacterium turcicum]|uniref:Por secretion system C-terminal sorting domain-containing protein n=1 Tax=Flavobacterium turcicum TaxID=2764718 RepID=A0ABR7JKC0_9FLAO|nr:DUF3244 domain-containing protein [Flavobacterium turcicum]MBC5864624.1 hypothetical protein [Flavobacterium turcicum]NHL03356.1 hypothetical protein [Flavobacterium turcicum]